MSTKKIFIPVAFVLFILSGVAGYLMPGYLESRRAEALRRDFTAPAIPDEVVAAFSRSFNDLSVATEPKYLPDGAFFKVGGGEARFSDFAGKPTLVNLWATWCAPCVVELPSLQKLAEHYEGRLNVIALSIEENKTQAEIADFLEKRMLSSFAGYVDKNGTILKNLGVAGIPTSFLIGSDGLILYRFQGDADWTSEESRAFFDALLLQKK